MTGKEKSLADNGKNPESITLLNDIRGMVEEARSHVAETVNAGLTMLYWRIGSRIHRALLEGKRAKYGAKIVVTVSQQLVEDYGNPRVPTPQATANQAAETGVRELWKADCKCTVRMVRITSMPERHSMVL